MEPGGPEHERAILSVLAACRKAGKVSGIYGGAHPERWLELGFLFVTATMDSAAIQEAARTSLAGLSRFRG